MTFKKGQSGNPSGRPKTDYTLKELCIKEGPKTIEKLIYWRDSRNAMASLNASKLLLEYGFGKPIQEVKADVKGAVYVNFSTPIKK